MRQRIVSIVAAGVLTLVGITGVLAQETTPEGATPAATINRAALSYEVHGDPNGHPVLLPDGLGSTEAFVNLAPVLVAAGYRMMAMDCRGHGRSACGDLPITYAQLAADAVGLLDALGIAKTDVVGWSDEAVIALHLAAHHPERLERVVTYGADFTPEGVCDGQSDRTPPSNAPSPTTGGCRPSRSASRR